MSKADRVKGDHNVFQAGSMMVKFYQNNYHHIKGTWTGESDDDYTEYEEVDDKPQDKKEEPNYFQTGRFLKRVCYGEWFELLSTEKRFTERWLSKMVDALMLTAWKEQLAEMWEDTSTREKLKGYVVGCLKDAGVVKGSYDAIARCMGYEGKDARTLSRYMSDGKKQDFHDWIIDYVMPEKQ